MVNGRNTEYFCLDIEFCLPFFFPEKELLTFTME